MLTTLPSLQSWMGGGVAGVGWGWRPQKPLGKHGLSTSARRPPYAHTGLAYVWQRALPHTHTRSAAPSLSNFLTFARTLICTSWPVSRGPYPLLWLWASGADTRFSHPSLPTASAAPFSLPPTPALTTSTKLTPQARSAESVGGVRCWHSPPHHHPPTQPLHWARLQDLTACSLSLTVL